MDSKQRFYLETSAHIDPPCKFNSPQVVKNRSGSDLYPLASTMLRAFFIHAQIFRLLLKISVEKANVRASHYFFLVSPFRWDKRQAKEISTEIFSTDASIEASSQH